jgi:hypothetical protein
MISEHELWLSRSTVPKAQALIDAYERRSEYGRDEFQAGVFGGAFKRIADRSQGYYPDGWAGPRARFVLGPPRGRIIEARVRFPEGTPVTPQRLLFHAHGTTVARACFDSGEYTFPVAIPRAYWNEPVFLTISASRFFWSSVAPRRKLSYMLTDLGFTEDAR